MAIEPFDDAGSCVMYALTIALLGVMLLAWDTASTQPQQTAFQNQVTGDAAAVNFWAYRSALVKYTNKYPANGGTISDEELNKLFPEGYVRHPPWSRDHPPWSNVVWNNMLHTYSTKPLPASTIEAIAARGGRTLMIGIAQNNGKISSLYKSRDGDGMNGGAPSPAIFDLPPQINPGAFVVIGN